MAGRAPQNTKGGLNKVLNPDQEEALKQFIDFMIYLGHRADLKTVRAAANKILGKRFHLPSEPPMGTTMV